MFNSKKIEPGMICVYDASNATKQDITGILNVQVQKRVLKKGLMSSENIWEVKSIEGVNPQPFHCQEKYLTPTENVVCIVRNPIDMPTFNQKDIDGIDQAIMIIKSYSHNTSDKGICDMTLNRLEAMKEKIKFNMSLREV